MRELFFMKRERESLKRSINYCIFYLLPTARSLLRYLLANVVKVNADGQILTIDWWPTPELKMDRAVERFHVPVRSIVVPTYTSWNAKDKEESESVIGSPSDLLVSALVSKVEKTP